MNLYYILNAQSHQEGPYTVDQIRVIGIHPQTLVWCQGMPQWIAAYQVPELAPLVIHPPGAGQYAGGPAGAPPPYGHDPYSQAYEDHFDINQMPIHDQQRFTQHGLDQNFNVALAILLHFLTLGIFSIIYLGVIHGKLPKVRHNDFNAGKAIGFLFIPYFNFYWIFVFWRRLAMRVNFQYKLRGMQAPVPLGLITTMCILLVIPYLGIIAFFFVGPFAIAKILGACNELADRRAMEGLPTPRN